MAIRHRHRPWFPCDRCPEKATNVISTPLVNSQQSKAMRYSEKIRNSRFIHGQRWMSLHPYIIIKDKQPAGWVYTKPGSYNFAWKTLFNRIPHIVNVFQKWEGGPYGSGQPISNSF